ncbi:PIF1-like helicase-domain-containing protein, partial [Mycena maculata]
MGRENPTDDNVCDYGLFLLDEILGESGHTLADFEMPTPQYDWSVQAENPLIVEQLNYDAAEECALAEADVQKMNVEQHDAFDRIVASVEQKLGKGFFLSGSGGTGKMFVYNAMAHHRRGQSKIVLCVASSGISALLLRGGRTAHSMFKILIEGLTAESTCCIPKESQRAALIRVTDLII